MGYCTCGKIRAWTSTGKFIDGRRQWKCRNCGRVQLEEHPQGLKIPPKILYLDIETALMSVEVYDLYVRNKFISKDFIREHSFVINWAAAWLTTDWRIKDRQIISGVVTVNEAKKRTDKRILKPLWQMMETADYIGGHNSDNFDIKKLQWRFLKNSMGFPAPSKRLDTYKIYGKYTKPESRGLEHISLELGGRRKKSLDGQEWREIIAPETDGERRGRLLRKADRYCRGDVTEGVRILSEIATAIEGAGVTLVR